MKKLLRSITLFFKRLFNKKAPIELIERKTPFARYAYIGLTSGKRHSKWFDFQNGLIIRKPNSWRD